MFTNGVLFYVIKKPRAAKDRRTENDIYYNTKL